jgi:hypothetical protein
MKRLWPCVFLLMGNESVSYMVLTALLLMFLGIIIKQSEGRA